MRTTYIFSAILALIWFSLWIRDYRKRTAWVRKIVDVKPTHFDTDLDVGMLPATGLTMILAHSPRWAKVQKQMDWPARQQAAKTPFLTASTQEALAIFNGGRDVIALPPVRLASGRFTR
jgi:hypothetical protein